MGLLLNRVKATVSGTPGTGAVTPSTAVSTFRSFAAGGAISGQYYNYLIEEGTDWELGVGLYNGTTITRPGPGTDPWFESSTGALVSFTSAAVISCPDNASDFGRVLLAKHVCGVGETTFALMSAIPQVFDHLEIQGSLGSTSGSTTNTDSLILSVNGDTAAGRYGYEGYGIYAGPTGFNQGSSASATGIVIWGAASTGASASLGFSQIQIDIANYRAAKKRSIKFEAQAAQSNVGSVHTNGSGYYQPPSPAAITSINLSIAANAFATDSTFWLYGKR